MLTRQGSGISRSFVAVLALYFGFLAFEFLAGPGPILRYGHDVANLLSQAWRIHQGQVVDADFYQAVPMSALLYGWTAKLFGMSGSLAWQLNLIAFTFLFWLAWWASGVGTKTWVRLLFCVWIAGAVLGRHPLSHEVTEANYGSIFNRIAFALLSIQLILQGLSAGSREASDQGSIGLVAGIVSGFLALYKVGFAASSFAVFGVGWLLLGNRRKRPLALYLVGFAAAVGAVVAQGQISLPGYLRELARYSAVLSDTLRAETSNLAGLTFIERVSFRSSMNIGLAKFVATLANEFWRICLIGVPIAVLIRQSAPATRRRLFFSLGTIGLGLGMSLICWQWGEVLYVNLAAVLALAALTAPEAERDLPDLQRGAGWIALWVLAVVAVQAPVKSVASVLESWQWMSLHSADWAQRRQLLPRLIDDVTIFSDAANCPKGTFEERQHDGFKLISGLAAKGERVMVPDYVNLFPLYLESNPPTGDLWGWEYRYSFDLEHLPPWEGIRDGTDWIAVPKCPQINDSVAAFMRAYKPRLEESFALKGQSEYWALYGKKR